VTRTRGAALQGLAGRYLPDLVYGANDGIITTFAVVAPAPCRRSSPAAIRGNPHRDPWLARRPPAIIGPTLLVNLDTKENL
jgi:hypothetical protein